MNVSVQVRDASGVEDAAVPIDNNIASKKTETSVHQPETDILTSSSNQDADDEPNMALEPDLPSDGHDLVGEAMIRDLPQRPELSEPPSRPDPLTQEN